MTEFKIQREWADSPNTWETDPKDGGIQPILYWWEDMRPAEVRELVHEVYARGYSRGIRDWQPHEDPDRTAYVADLEKMWAVANVFLRDIKDDHMTPEWIKEMCEKALGLKPLDTSGGEE